MAKSNIRRVPFILNIDDPVDTAIWEALEPLLTRRRASAFIRSAIAQTLGITSPAVPLEPRALLPAPAIRTKRRVQEMPRLPAGGGMESEQDGDDLARATGNFLNMFG